MKRSAFMPVLLALLLAGLCLTNLTSCADSGGHDPIQTGPAPEQTAPAPAPMEPVEPSVPDPAVPADGPLTEEELKYFNEEFFNGDDMNLRNQFLSSAYDAPEDINLFELFYCGDGWDERMEDKEWTAFEAAGGFVDTDVTKVSAANADAVLTEHMGLTLAETNKVGLENFTYLEEYDAYYLAHGDTNYRMEVSITSGERKDGLICLYYEDDFYGGGWKRITLREVGDGYQFVSNADCDASSVPAA